MTSSQGKGTTTTKCLRVLIAYDNGHVYEWFGDNAEAWVKAMNLALFVVSNHGMDANVPKPTKEVVVRREERE